MNIEPLSAEDDILKQRTEEPIRPSPQPVDGAHSEGLQNHKPIAEPPRQAPTAINQIHQQAPHNSAITVDSTNNGTSVAMIFVYVLATIFIIQNGFAFLLHLPYISMIFLSPYTTLSLILAAVGVLAGIGLVMKKEVARVAVIIWLSISLCIIAYGILRTISVAGSSFGNILYHIGPTVIFYCAIIYLLTLKSVKQYYM